MFEKIQNIMLTMHIISDVFQTINQIPEKIHKFFKCEKER